MNNNDLISVIIPVYNVEQYLSRCIDSVINQTYKNLEIIFIDDGSTDNSGKICDEYALKDNRIKVIHKQNGGVVSARNTGLDIAKGEYIGFIDSDDYIEQDMYELLYKLSIENKVKVSCCNKFDFVKNRFVAGKNFPSEGVLSFHEMLNDSGHDLFLWNKLYSRQLIGNYRFDEKLTRGGDDISFTFDILKKANKIVFCKDAKYYWVENFSSLTRGKFLQKGLLNYIEFYDKLIKYCKENNLKIGYKKYKHFQLVWVVHFLSLIAREKPLKNKESLKLLLKYARKNLFVYLFGDFTIKSKCFLILKCINFNLASKIYRLIIKI